VDQKILDKIAAVLARADASRNDNPHERETAMRQANAMLIKHGLSMADVTDEGERKESMGAMGRKQSDMSTRYVWETGVWGYIARLNNCDVVRSPGRGRGKVWVIGRYLNVTVTQQMAEYVVNSIKREAKAQGHKVCDFGVGAWSGIGNQVKIIMAERERGIVDGEQMSEETALVVVNQNALAVKETGKAMRDFFPRLSSGGSYRHNGGSGHAAGKAFGASVRLNSQIGQSRRAIGNS